MSLRLAVRSADVAIVGGGFSGTIVAAGIARAASRPLDIVVFDRTGAFGRGAAYGPRSERCLLNVRADAMGAFPDDADEFARWLRARMPQAGPDLDRAFVPRRWYGDYLCDVLERCRSLPSTIERRAESVVDLEAVDGGYVVHAAGGSVVARAVVLALGNLPPGGVGDASLAAAMRRYARNPWEMLTDGALPTDGDVAIVGTGLSALDVVVEAHARGHRGRITALSRNGRFPLAHAPHASGTYRLAGPSGTPRDVLRALRAHARDAEAHGHRWHDVVDGVRPHAERIWQSWSEREKAQFERHLASVWSVHRHRAPAATLAIRDALVASGRLRVIAGRVVGVQPSNAGGLELTFAYRGSGVRETLRVDAIVDCSGPPRDLSATGDPLVHALFARGLAVPGPLGAGLLADPAGVVHRNGTAAIYALGSPLRGTFAESSAVRELRVAARGVAAAVVAACGDVAAIGELSRRETA